MLCIPPEWDGTGSPELRIEYMESTMALHVHDTTLRNILENFIDTSIKLRRSLLDDSEGNAGMCHTTWKWWRRRSWLPCLEFPMRRELCKADVDATSCDASL